VARAARGDRRAFERVYRTHVARVHALVRRMVGAEEAEEVTQDVFVRAWQRLGTFRGEAAFGTWLHRLAVNVVFDHRARMGRQRARFIGDDAALEAAPDRPRDAIERADFERGIDALPDGARLVLVLHDVEGYRHEEIAERLGVTVGTTKSQLHRARLLLRRHLDA
jgi:RNA polymerase sigma-70 factor (ECF subfamily)